MRWNPIHTVETIVISVVSMLSDPTDESPANIDAAVIQSQPVSHGRITDLVLIGRKNFVMTSPHSRRRLLAVLPDHKRETNLSICFVGAVAWKYKSTHSWNQRLSYATQYLRTMHAH